MTQKNRYFILFILLTLALQSKGNSLVQEPEVYRRFSPNFKERYSTKDNYNYEGTEIVGYTQRGSGNYEDYKKKKTEIEEDKDQDRFSINLGPLKWLFYIALGIAVVYLVYILINEGTSGSLFSKSKSKPIHDYNAINAENIAHADIHALIQQAEADNNYRLAIRYYYLLVLKTLNTKNIIRFEDDKTNAEYLNELHEHPLGKGFSYISYLYNYIWYGKFEVDDKQYQKAKTNFINFLKQVNA